ncbi:MAG: metalloregulator ArsR/SmtB family transcription factor [Desulfuromonadales bacterium]
MSNMKQNAQIYKALADETRLRILALLLSEGELCVCDIIAALKLPQSTISRHLAYLRKTEWVNDRRCGLWIYYSLRSSDDNKKELISVLKKQLLTTKASIDDCALLASFGNEERCG